MNMVFVEGLGTAGVKSACLDLLAAAVLLISRSLLVSDNSALSLPQAVLRQPNQIRVIARARARSWNHSSVDKSMSAVQTGQFAQCW